jgi:tetratricopeptide (TPR) repeat protein
MNIYQLREELRADAVQDLTKALQGLERWLLPATEERQTVLNLRGQYNKAEEDYRQGLITLDQRDVVLNRIRLTLLEMIQELQADQMVEEIGEAPVPEADASPVFAYADPPAEKDPAAWLPWLQAQVGHVRGQQGYLFQTTGEHLIPAGQWMQKIGEKMAQPVDEPFDGQAFLRSMMNLTNLIAEKINGLNLVLQQLGPEFRHFYAATLQLYQRATHYLEQQGLSQWTAEQREGFQQTIGLLEQEIRRAEEFHHELQKMEGMGPIAQVLIFNPLAHRALHRMFDHLSSIREVLTDFLHGCESPRLRLELLLG